LHTIIIWIFDILRRALIRKQKQENLFFGFQEVCLLIWGAHSGNYDKNWERNQTEMFNIEQDFVTLLTDVYIRDMKNFGDGQKYFKIDVFTATFMP